MSDAPRLAVVVVSFEARETLLAGLDALRAHASFPLELVVVDNASTDGSADAVRARHAEALVIANAENLGFARACNQGWRASRAAHVLFLNPDAEVTPGAVETLVALLEARPAVGAAGPRTLGSDGTIQVSTGPDLTPLAELRQRGLVRGVARRDARALARAEALHAREHEPAWVSGSCLVARRAALEAVGGFDERFFLYEEDADLCRRLRETGWGVVFTPEAEVKHHLGRSMSKAPRRARLDTTAATGSTTASTTGPLARGAADPPRHAGLCRVARGERLGRRAGARGRGRPRAPLARAIVRRGSRVRRGGGRDSLRPTAQPFECEPGHAARLFHQPAELLRPRFPFRGHDHAVVAGRLEQKRPSPAWPGRRRREAQRDRVLPRPQQVPAVVRAREHAAHVAPVVRHRRGETDP